MILARIGNLLRPHLDRAAVRRIRKAFPHARSFIDLGCGMGGIGRMLGADLVDTNPAMPDVIASTIEDFQPSRRYDVAVMSNVYEHLHRPMSSLANVRTFADGLWMSFTPWLSPFGGHEFAPWHLFGRTNGPIHELGVNLFKTSRLSALIDLDDAGWFVVGIRSRYVPWAIRNDFLLWNIEIISR